MCRWIIRISAERQVSGVDKSELMEAVLDRYNVRFNPAKSGWQPIRCPNEAGHTHGDSNPSCSLHLGFGSVNCHGCGLKGDGYSVLIEVEGITFKQAAEQLGGVNVEEEQSDWIIL